MTPATSKPRGLAHATFLERQAREGRETSLDGRLAQAAFLALRLVDLLGGDREGVRGDAFHYQYVATDRLCRQLPANATETSHVSALVGSAWDAFQEKDIHLAVPALLAYAHYLEDELRLEEALDVLETLLRLGGDRLRSSDAIAADLRIGRVNRKLSRFDDGEAAYLAAAGLAEAAGDVHAALLSRVGRAISIQARGNLAEAEQVLRELCADAHVVHERDVEARAHHTLGTTLVLRGQVAEGIVHAWRAVELYEDESSRVRALGDLGAMLLAVGEAASAERALLEVIRRGCAMQDVVSNALIELMHCASYRRDRLGFERWRVECRARTPIMPSNILADFYLKAGIGHARFGQFRLAEDLMAKALKIAESAGLHEFFFRIERMRRGLRDCEAEVVATPDAAAEPIQNCDSGVREVAASLARLAM